MVDGMVTLGKATEVVTAHVVRCVDGKVRHQWPFDSRRAASTFAAWGHCCMSQHEMEEMEVVLTADVERRPDGQLVGVRTAA